MIIKYEKLIVHIEIDGHLTNLTCNNLFAHLIQSSKVGVLHGQLPRDGQNAPKPAIKHQPTAQSPPPTV